MRVSALLTGMFLFAAGHAAVAQTTTVYPAPSGVVQSTLATTMYFTGGGSAFLNPNVGPNCYFGMVCGFPAGYAGTYMSYQLPDGTTATLTNFHGKFEPYGAGYVIEGAASGLNSAGQKVEVNFTAATMTVFCYRGCSKTYTKGGMKLTVY